MTETFGLSSPEGIASGEPLVESFDGFYLRQYRQVLALANVLTGDHGVAEDLTQEAFVAAFRSWSSIDSPEHWVRSVLTKRARSWWRRVYAARRAAVKMYEPGAGIETLPPDTEDFWSEVRRLPARQALVVALYYLDDRPTEEVARIVGCEPSTVRIHLSRARKTLARRMKVER